MKIPLGWSIELPTAAGWYWRASNEDGERELVVVPIRLVTSPSGKVTPQQRREREKDWEDMSDTRGKWLWSGPLPPPAQ